MPSAYVTGALLTVLAVAGSSAAQTCVAPYTTFTDGTDYFGNDLKSMMGTEEECVIACESDPACFALIIKASGSCYLKNSHFMDEAPLMLEDTITAVDLSCLRGGVIAGSEPTVDGEMTSTMVTVMVGDKYVTTKSSWPTADPSAVTATSYYSDAEGVFEEGTDVLPTPEMTTIPGSKPKGATEEPKDTMVFTTTIDETVISTYVEQKADGTTSSYSTTSPPQAVPTPEPENGTVDMVSEGQYLIKNTAEVGSEYITVTSDFYSVDGVANNTNAFYSDAEGNPVEGGPMLLVTSVTDPLATDDAPFSTDTVTLEDGSTVTITSTRTADGSVIATESLVMEAPTGPMTPDTDGTDEEESGEESGEAPAEESAEEAAVPEGTPVLAPAPPPPGSSAATSIAVMGSVLACAVFGAMML